MKDKISRLPAAVLNKDFPEERLISYNLFIHSNITQTGNANFWQGLIIAERFYPIKYSFIKMEIPNSKETVKSVWAVLRFTLCIPPIVAGSYKFMDLQWSKARL
jgi:hypothetical protein